MDTGAEGTSRAKRAALETGMLLGIDPFLAHRIQGSRLQRKVCLTWNGGPVFAGNQAAAARGDFARAASHRRDAGLARALNSRCWPRCGRALDGQDRSRRA